MLLYISLITALMLLQKHVDAELEGRFASLGWDADRMVLERTGPGIWSRAIEGYLRTHGSDLKQVLLEATQGGSGVLVGDMWVLPQLAFGCPSELIQMEALGDTLRRMTEGSTSRRGAGSVEGRAALPPQSVPRPHSSLVYHQFMGSWRSVPLG